MKHMKRLMTVKNKNKMTNFDHLSHRGYLKPKA